MPRVAAGRYGLLLPAYAEVRAFADGAIFEWCASAADSLSMVLAIAVEWTSLFNALLLPFAPLPNVALFLELGSGIGSTDRALFSLAGPPGLSRSSS